MGRHSLTLIGFLLAFQLALLGFAKDDKSSESLPPLLIANDGSKVSTSEQWLSRREEIKNLLQDQVYGYLPKDFKMKIRVQSESKLATMPGIYRDVRLQFPDQKSEIKLAVFLPSTETKSKIFLVLNKCGNQTVSEEPSVVTSGDEWLHTVHCYKKGAPISSGGDQDQYPVAEILRAGYGFASFAESDMAADSPSHPQVGLYGKFGLTNADKRKNWGTLMAWAFGFMRAVDYLVDAPGIDSKGIFVVGHSRRGKAALLAGAFDDRIATVVAHQSGLGGTALMRNPFGRESASMIANGWVGYPLMEEPEGLTHFFAPIFRKASRKPNLLAFDSHFLVALVAPRRLLDFEGTKDFWAGGKSASIALKAASPAWDLYSSDGHTEVNLTHQGEDLEKIEVSPLAQYFAQKGHSLASEDWQVFLKFVSGR